MKIKQSLQILNILLILFFNSFFAQSYKIIYDFKWKSNKKSKQYNNELCALITNENQVSFFESYENFKIDSLKTKIIKDYTKGDRKGSLRIPSNEKKALFRPIIIKNSIEKTITIEEEVFVKIFSTTYNCVIQWKINPDETQNILDYKTQKATCEFGGRRWTAWFTNEIPIMDGPYKFIGLPGLILKIQDSEINYVFEIKSITKENNDIEHRNFGSSKVSNLSLKQWENFWKNYKNLPSMVLENLNTEKTTYVIDGKDVNNTEVKDSYNKKEWEAMKYFEEPIEKTISCN